MLLRLAIRNLRLHWVRSLIVGVLLSLGTAILVVGLAGLDAIETGMERSVVQTLSGHLQVISGAAPDTLELYQSSILGESDLDQLDDYAALKRVLEADPDVAHLVPMALGRSLVWGTSPIEDALERLRNAIRLGHDSQLPALRTHVERLIIGLGEDLAKVDAVATDTEEAQTQRQDLARAQAPDFWNDFSTDPQPTLEFLDNRIAPIGGRSGIYFFNYVGTDPQAFAKHFELFRVEAGEMIPEGERGFMFNSHYYERFVKNQVARRLDLIKEARDYGGDRIATSQELQQMLLRNTDQIGLITDTLQPERLEPLILGLQQLLNNDSPEFPELLRIFFAMDDTNFDTRYRFFYDEIGPYIRLYAYRVGDEVALYGQTKSGYPKAALVKVWGVFRYEGLERSGLAGVYNIIDLETFRDLAGFSGGVSADEIAEILDRAEIQHIDREDAEDALFGGDAIAEERESASLTDATDRLGGLRPEDAARHTLRYTQEELENGPLLNVAIFLRDGLEQDPVALRAAQKRIEHTLNTEPSLQRAGSDAPYATVLTWHDARGPLVAGLMTGITLFFYGIVGLIFFVAFIVILNSLLMSTFERTQEIGTIRAIGGSRALIWRIFAVEGLAMALIFGLFGLTLGAVTVLILGQTGLHAHTEMLTFVYGGRSLQPSLSWDHLSIAFVVITTVTLISTLIPAMVATRVNPITAMQAKE